MRLNLGHTKHEHAVGMFEADNGLQKLGELKSVYSYHNNAKTQQIEGNI